MTAVAATTPFGEMVAALRAKKGWSQPELARAAGLSVGYIGGIEAGLRGRNPSRATIIKIARALGEPAYDLLVAAGKDRPEDDPKARPTRPSFEAFVTGDPMLTPQEREMLIRLYRSYVGGQGRR